MQAQQASWYFLNGGGVQVSNGYVGAGYKLLKLLEHRAGIDSANTGFAEGKP
jgi:hypothetical protein